ncbi:MAG TPA: bifunctional UDP-sugar hydrolase/5'-nucleotidase [Ktedonosporobacter sp.]|nr:bifunctional UDP-sugar hydrolase/5'-nucleotidase [Ktedonosporobacter sp.]
MQKIIILHSNDIHGNIEGLARISTLVKQIRAENPAIPVFYLDAGDIEENTVRVSNFTRGAAMHRLLSIAGCQAETIGNGGILRYGFEVLADYGTMAQHPLLLANIRRPDNSQYQGVQDTTILQENKLKLGLIGITDNLGNEYSRRFGQLVLPEVPLVRRLAGQLRHQGADAVILLSHMGLDQDRELAADLQEEISLIIGAHSHHALSEGELVGKVLIAQAGIFAQYLGRLDLLWDDTQLIVEEASLIPIDAEITPDPAIQAEIETIEADLVDFLDVIVGELAEPLDFATDRECKMGNMMADMLRARMQADVGIIVAINAGIGPLAAGPLRRKTLWETCQSIMNPAVTQMTGEQLCAVIARGQDRAFAASGSRAQRCHERGLLHLSGASIRDGQIFVGEQLIQPEQFYRVAASHWELRDYGGYVKKAWDLSITYDVPTTLCDAMEAYLMECSPIRVSSGRLG